MRRILAAVLFFAGLACVQAQDEFNPNSINPIAASEQLFKFRVWRDVDLKEKSNQGFFSNNGEISRVFLSAAKSGELQLYAYDSLQYALTPANVLISRTELIERLSKPFNKGNSAPWDSTKRYFSSSGDTVEYKGKFFQVLQDVGPQTASDLSTLPAYELRSLAAAYGVPNAQKMKTPELVNNIVKASANVKHPDADANLWLPLTGMVRDYFSYKDITKMRIMEDMIFDRRRSRLFHDIQAIQFFTVDDTGRERSLGFCKYKDLVKVFDAHPRESIWFNRYNPAQNKPFQKAFELRLFKSTLWKVENPDDSDIASILRDNKRPLIEQVLALEWEEMRLMEKEHNLWTY